MKIKWEQSGMPVSLVSRLGRRTELSEFRSVLSDARDQVQMPLDAETMAQELVRSGGREFVEIVRELTTALAAARKALDASDRRCARLAAELEAHGIPADGELPAPSGPVRAPAGACPAEEAPHPASEADGQAVWEEWNRRFQALLG